MPSPGSDGWAEEAMAPDADRIRSSYDAMALAYDEQLGDELDHKPLDRALLSAFLELVGAGTVGDVGCGPGHVTRAIAQRHPDVVGVDLSPVMVDVARLRAPELSFLAGSMLALPVRDAAWAGAVALYAVINLAEHERAAAFSELARVVRPGGWLLVSFHVESPETAAGQVLSVSSMLGVPVDLDVHFLDPDQVSAQLVTAGFEVTARLDRAPVPGHEFPSRRCSLVARRS
jgi:ubiquinone/menaquinone biosynthesis C-methylase UbiE